MPYMANEKRVRLHEAIKAELERAILEGRAVSSVDIARAVGISEAFVCRVRKELVKAGVIPVYASAKMMGRTTGDYKEVIQARIEAVKAAKDRKMIASHFRKRKLTREQLRRVLPS